MEILDLLLAFKWLTCYYLKKTYDRVQRLKKSGSDNFEARNDSQTYFARTLSLVYAEVLNLVLISKLIEYIRIIDDSKLRLISFIIFNSTPSSKPFVIGFKAGILNPKSNLF